MLRILCRDNEVGRSCFVVDQPSASSHMTPSFTIAIYTRVVSVAPSSSLLWNVRSIPNDFSGYSNV